MRRNFFLLLCGLIAFIQLIECLPTQPGATKAATKTATATKKSASKVAEKAAAGVKDGINKMKSKVCEKSNVCSSKTAAKAPGEINKDNQTSKGIPAWKKITHVAEGSYDKVVYNILKEVNVFTSQKLSKTMDETALHNIVNHISKGKKQLIQDLNNVLLYDKPLPKYDDDEPVKEQSDSEKKPDKDNGDPKKQQQKQEDKKEGKNGDKKEDKMEDNKKANQDNSDQNKEQQEKKQ